MRTNGYGLMETQLRPFTYRPTSHLFHRRQENARTRRDSAYNGNLYATLTGIALRPHISPTRGLYACEDR